MKEVIIKIYVNRLNFVSSVHPIGFKLDEPADEMKFNVSIYFYNSLLIQVFVCYISPPTYLPTSGEQKCGDV